MCFGLRTTFEEIASKAYQFLGAQLVHGTKVRGNVLTTANTTHSQPHLFDRLHEIGHGDRHRHLGVAQPPESTHRAKRPCNVAKSMVGSQGSRSKHPQESRKGTCFEGNLIMLGSPQPSVLSLDP